jgi:hypothetical protein
LLGARDAQRRADILGQQLLVVEQQLPVVGRLRI